MNQKTLLMGTLSVVALSACKQEKKPEQPNILLILADDMGWSDLGCYGAEIQTPHLDSLAYNGIRFTQFFNASICYPSRGCLLTGLYAQQCGMINEPYTGFHNPGYLTNSVTLGEVLKEANYRTLMVGKHHGKDNPYDRGFDRYYGLRDGCCNYFNPGIQREGEGPPARKNGSFPRKWCIDGQTLAPFTPAEKDFYTTDYFTKYAVNYLETYRDEDKPFFLYLSYTAPHTPLQAWPEDIAKYEDMYHEGYEKYRKARYERQKEMGLIDRDYPLSAMNYENWDSLSKEERRRESRRMAVYAAMIDRMDQNIGKVLGKLRKMGELDNTLILFSSDNGATPEEHDPPGPGFNSDTGQIGSITRWGAPGPDWSNVSNTPYKYYKGWTHHGGMCAPLIAFWPEGIKGENRISEYPGHFIDFMPTLVEVAGAKYPETYNDEKIPPMEGTSLVPVFNDEKPAERALFWQYSGTRAVRNNGWRLVSGKRSGMSSWYAGSDTTGWELYNMKVDKTETENLIDQYPEKADSLEMLYQRWYDRMMQHMER